MFSMKTYICTGTKSFLACGIWKEHEGMCPLGVHAECLSWETAVLHSSPHLAFLFFFSSIIFPFFSLFFFSPFSFFFCFTFFSVLCFISSFFLFIFSFYTWMTALEHHAQYSKSSATDLCCWLLALKSFSTSINISWNGSKLQVLLVIVWVF